MELNQLIEQTKEVGSVCNSVISSVKDLHMIGSKMKHFSKNASIEVLVMCTEKQLRIVKEFLKEVNSRHDGVIGGFEYSQSAFEWIVEASIYVDGYTFFFIPKFGIKDSIIIPVKGNVKPEECIVILNED